MDPPAPVTTCLADFSSLPASLFGSPSVKVLEHQAGHCGFFSFSRRLGLFFTVEGAFFSVLSVSFILFYAFYRWAKKAFFRLRHSDLARPSDASDSALFLNLMLADLLQAIGFFPNVRWMALARVESGTLCTAQAVLKQIGIVNVSLSSLAIAVHTFVVLVLDWRDRGPVPLSFALVITVWVATALIVGIPNALNRSTTNPYYGPTSYWCWITEGYKTERIVTEYLWVWLAGLCMILLYGIMFLDMRGHLTIFSKKKRETAFALDADEVQRRQLKAIANSLLFYPAVYVACTFPNSLSRWLEFSGNKPPYQFTLFANTVFALSGTANLVLFLLTRPNVVIGPGSPSPGPSEREDDEKLGHGEPLAHDQLLSSDRTRHDSISTVSRPTQGPVVVRANHLPPRPRTLAEEYDDEDDDGVYASASGGRLPARPGASGHV